MENFKKQSPSEYFYANKEHAGFVGARPLFVSMRELFENSIDGCEHAGILPDIVVNIKKDNQEKAEEDDKDPTYILEVIDNGPGMPNEHIPMAFGTLLYGSKFGLKQARGMFGLGASMAIMYGQLTANKPVIVKSSTDGQTQHIFKMLIDIKRNKPIIQDQSVNTKGVKRGMSIKIILKGNYSQVGLKIREYIRLSALIAPYANITLNDPKGETYKYNRLIKTMPAVPTEIPPHPHGIDVEKMKRMMSSTYVPLPDFTTTTLYKELKLNQDSDIQTILKKKVKSLSNENKYAGALALITGLHYNDLKHIVLDDIDYRNDKLLTSMGDFKIDRNAPYYSIIEKEIKGIKLKSFLINNFQRIGPGAAKKFCNFAKFSTDKYLGEFTNQDLVKLCSSMQAFTGFMTPDASCLAPLGEEALQVGIEKIYEPEFCAVVKRTASAYSGFPFIVEAGIAYGGKVPSGGPLVKRFANYIPLLYDEGSDVSTRLVNSIDWRRYKLPKESPFVVVTHICSTKVPYKGAGKENVANIPEVENELKNAMFTLGKKISVHMTKRGKAEAEKKRREMFQQYIPALAKYTASLAGKKVVPKCEKLLNGENTEEVIAT